MRPRTPAADPAERPTAAALLAATPGPAASAALAAALPTAATREHEAMVAALLRRGEGGGRLALVRHLHRLGPRAAERVYAVPDHALDAAVRRAFGAGTDATRNALRLIAERRLCHLAYLVVDATSLPRPDLADEAAAVLVSLAGDAAPGSTEAATLAAAVDPAVAAWGRPAPRGAGGPVEGHGGLLTAFLLLAGEPSPLCEAAFAEPSHGALPPLRRRVAAAGGAAERGALLPLLAVEPLRSAALAGLARAARERPLRGVFPQPALLSEPAVAAALAAAAEPGSLCPRAWPAEASPTERRCLVDLVAALPLPPATRSRWVALALADPEPAVRAAALKLVVRDLAEAGDPALLAAAAALAASAATPEARLAARVVAAAPEARRGPHLAALHAAADPAVRAAAEDAEAAEAAQRLLAELDRLDGPARARALADCRARPGGERALRARLAPAADATPARRRALVALAAAMRTPAGSAPPLGRVEAADEAWAALEARLPDAGDPPPALRLPRMPGALAS
ncbi:hypothetical protein [Phycisphaera mikurensis]|uniref:HEAT repeat-containing protein n=1 Tax=Phycisphaera mikurensis (strain NBRC 102666 / KCTC 22515 / FYK2301M01) TaxID=1142394 RepID=I0IBP9_PHYMF|nr:hypothetical protein [Phycisphaera mikurensis]MBB6443383.1 hypothetical protein [Phycisphaera mikurensis]BAM02687.1 hypothetical protein PSMK_05280 [Phycisphaera mikurensis NBRC 102666]